MLVCYFDLKLVLLTLCTVLTNAAEAKGVAFISDGLPFIRNVKAVHFKQLSF